jgi:kynurenine formamidase
MRKYFLLFVVILSLGCERTAPSSLKPVDSFAGTIVDLTHSYGADTLYWPTDEKGFQFERGNNGRTPKGYYYAANRFSTAEHGGTHLDAPIHFAEGHPTADQVELRRLLGEGVVVDVTAACDKDVNYLVTVADLQRWEEQNKRQFVDVILLLKTGWAKRWPDRQRYLGTPRQGPEAIPELQFPGLSPDAARWLVDHRAIKAIGIDTASIDNGPSTHFESHQVFCEKSVPILENVADLDAVPTQGATIIALPMKIAGGSGGPLRIIAVVRK